MLPNVLLCTVDAKYSFREQGTTNIVPGNDKAKVSPENIVRQKVNYLFDDVEIFFWSASG